MSIASDAIRQTIGLLPAVGHNQNTKELRTNYEGRAKRNRAHRG